MATVFYTVSMEHCWRNAIIMQNCVYLLHESTGSCSCLNLAYFVVIHFLCFELNCSKLQNVGSDKFLNSAENACQRFNSLAFMKGISRKGRPALEIALRFLNGCY